MSSERAEAFAQIASAFTTLARLEGSDSATRSPASRTSRFAAAPGDVASDEELQSEFGDRVLRFDPKRWNGPSYAGRKMSECPSAYLDAQADLLEWKGVRPKDGPDGAKFAERDLKDAARCRGWSRRNAGKSFSPDPPSRAEAEREIGDTDDFGNGSAGDDDLPFAPNRELESR